MRKSFYFLLALLAVCAAVPFKKHGEIRLEREDYLAQANQILDENPLIDGLACKIVHYLF